MNPGDEVTQEGSSGSEKGAQKMGITIIHYPYTVLDFITSVLLQRIKTQ